MKTKLFTAMLMVLSITACKKEIKLEVKQIKETDKTTEWNITTNRPVFSATEIEKSCVKINDEITGLVNGIKAASRNKPKNKIPAWTLSVRNKLPHTNYSSQTAYSWQIKTTSAY